VLRDHVRLRANRELLAEDREDLLLRSLDLNGLKVEFLTRFRSGPVQE